MPARGYYCKFTLNHSSLFSSVIVWLLRIDTSGQHCSWLPLGGLLAMVIVVTKARIVTIPLTVSRTVTLSRTMPIYGTISNPATISNPGTVTIP